MGRVRDWWGQRDENRRRRRADRRRRSERDAAIGDLDHIGTDYRPSTGWTDRRYQAPDPYGAFETGEEEPRSSRRERREKRRRERLLLPADHGPPSTRQRRERARADRGPDERQDATPSSTGAVGARPGARRAPAGGSKDAASRRSRTPRWYVVVPVVAVVALLGGRLAIGDGIGGISFGATPSMQAVWALDLDALSGSSLADVGSVDGTVDGTVLVTDAGWVVLVDGYSSTSSSLDSDAVLALVDPDDGEPLWTRELPGARCTLLTDGLTCLTTQDDTLSLVRVDLASGDIVGDPVETGLDRAAIVLQPLGDGLLVVDETGLLTHLGIDGTTVWSEHARLPQWDPDVGTTSTAAYPDAVWVSLRLGDVLVATTEGIVLRTECRDLSALPDGVICRYDDTIGYSPTGQQRWTNEFRDPKLIGRYQRVLDVAVADLRDGGIGVLDPMSGEAPVQARLEDTDDWPRSVVGNADHPVVLSEDGAVLLLRPGGAGKVWESEVRDEYLSIAGGGVVDGVVVVDGEYAHGFDLATGETLWRYESPPGDLDVVDGRLLVRGYRSLAVYELPES